MAMPGVYAYTAAPLPVAGEQHPAEGLGGGQGVDELPEHARFYAFDLEGASSSSNACPVKPQQQQYSLTGLR
jgi:hypothetical protein